MMNNNCGCRNNCCLLQAIQSIMGDRCDCNKGIQKGSLVLSNGHHEVQIKTISEPTDVFISLDSLDGQVCGGDIDVAGVKILADGFVLYADIKSSECV